MEECRLLSYRDEDQLHREGKIGIVALKTEPVASEARGRTWADGRWVQSRVSLQLAALH